MGTWLALTDSLDLGPLGTCLHGASVPGDFAVTPKPVADQDLRGRTQSCQWGTRREPSQKSSRAVCQALEQAKRKKKKQVSTELCAAFQALYPEEEDRQRQTENSSKNTRRATQMQQRDELEAWISFLQCLVFI